MAHTAAITIKAFEENFIAGIANPVKIFFARLIVRLLCIIAFTVTALLVVRFVALGVLFICVLIQYCPVIPFVTL